MLECRAEQKLISFSDNLNDYDKIKEDMKNGWSIISLMQNGAYYIGVMEKVSDYSMVKDNQQIVYIPPKKKITISYT